MIDCIPWKQCPTCIRTLFSWNAIYHGTHDIILWTLGHFRRPGDSQLMQTLATTILDLVAMSPAIRPLKSERHPHVISQSVTPRELRRCYKLWHNLCHLSAVIHVFLKISNINSIYYVCSSTSNKYKFVQIVQETAAFDCVLTVAIDKISMCYNRQCLSKDPVFRVLTGFAPVLQFREPGKIV